jgi:hypothetical protein
MKYIEMQENVGVEEIRESERISIAVAIWRSDTNQIWGAQASSTGGGRQYDVP